VTTGAAGGSRSAERRCTPLQPLRGNVFGRLYLTEEIRCAGLTEDDEIVVRALPGQYEKSRRWRRRLEATAEVTSQLPAGGAAALVLPSSPGVRST